MSALKSNFKNMCLNVETLISLFDTYVASVMKYWIVKMQIVNLEKVHL